jgi:hypothetical protein
VPPGSASLRAHRKVAGTHHSLRVPLNGRGAVLKAIIRGAGVCLGVARHNRDDPPRQGSVPVIGSVDNTSDGSVRL